MEIPQRLKEFIDNTRGSLNRPSLPPVTDPDEPLELDSLNLVRLIAFLEDELGYQFEDEEIKMENFGTLRQLGHLLSTKKPTGPDHEPGR